MRRGPGEPLTALAISGSEDQTSKSAANDRMQKGFIESTKQSSK